MLNKYSHAEFHSQIKWPTSKSRNKTFSTLFRIPNQSCEFMEFNQQKLRNKEFGFQALII